MNLIKSNIKRNFSTYFFYYIALVLNVSVVYIFLSMPANDSLLRLMKSFDNLFGIFKIAAFVVGLFSVMFVNYCINYFVKNRSKEIGLYSLFGMKKSKISFLLMLENIIVGIFAIATGIVIGIFLSKLVLMIMMKYLNLSTLVTIDFNIESVIWTIGFYLSILLLSSVFIFIQVYKASLLELFNKKIKAEKMIKASLLLGVLGVLLLLFGYGIGFYGVYEIEFFLTSIVLTLICSIVGTFLFFRNFMTAGLNKIIGNKEIAYKEGRIIWIRRISHRIGTSYKIISIITILIAVALTAIGITNGLNIQLIAFEREEQPYHMNYIVEDFERDAKVLAYLENNNSTVVENRMYKVKAFDDYKYAISDENFADYDVQANESIAYYSKYTTKDLEEKNLILKGQKFKIIEHVDKNLLNSYPVGELYIVDEKAYEKISSPETINRGIVFDDMYKNIIPLAEIEELIDVEPFNYSTVLDAIKVLILFKIVVFISVIIGIIFVFSSASILYIKIINSTVEDRESFITLSQIGYNQEKLKSFIKKHTKIIYYLPLVVGTVHSTVAVAMLKVLMNRDELSGLNYRDIVWPTFKIFLLFYIVYYIFYRITLKKSYQKVFSN